MHVGKAIGEHEIIHVITDVYKDVSIKSAEMIRIGSDDGVVATESSSGDFC